eukprot:11724540-Alexandrium_andersonii.AAC.1
MPGRLAERLPTAGRQPPAPVAQAAQTVAALLKDAPAARALRQRATEALLAWQRAELEPRIEGAVALRLQRGAVAQLPSLVEAPKAERAGGGHGLAGAERKLMNVAEKICSSDTFPADVMHGPAVEVALQLCAGGGACQEALQ